MRLSLQILRTLPIETAFKVYLKLLNFPFEKWQIRSMIQTIQHTKYAWSNSRRIGKTLRGVTIMVFYALIGRKIECRWGSDDQLREPRYFFGRNPFVKKVTKYFIWVYGNETPMHLSPLTPKKSHSVGCDVLWLDEERDMVHDLVTEAIIMTRNSMSPLVLHTSTAAVGTPFDTYYHECKKDGLVFDANVNDVVGNWVNKAEIEKDRETMPDWLFRREIMNEWTVPGGAVFENIQTTEEVLDNPDKAGIDWNPSYGHTMVLTREDRYICGAYLFSNIVALADFCKTLRGVSIEAEGGGGINDPWVKELRALGVRCSDVAWTAKTQTARALKVCRSMLVINPNQTKHSRQLYDAIRSAGWDSNSKNAQIKEDALAHWTDALLHAVHNIKGDLKWYPRSQTDKTILISPY